MDAYSLEIWLAALACCLLVFAIVQRRYELKPIPSTVTSVPLAPAPQPKNKNTWQVNMTTVVLGALQTVTDFAAAQIPGYTPHDFELENDERQEVSTVSRAYIFINHCKGMKPADLEDTA